MLVELREGNCKCSVLTQSPEEGVCPDQALLFAMFLMHYTWRSFAYPWMQRGGKPMPAFIWAMASAFCMFNGYLQVLAACAHMLMH